MTEPVVINARYELGRRIGRGGMAEVFVARDRLLDRPVAVKILFLSMPKTHYSLSGSAVRQCQRRR